ncbi:ParB/RepB/Spo0J family partition protein [Streptomyces sp. NPDC127068]|uniref:ParB/RepB/Spo0J family partition protein n=1 Tax=Streptomyces sp. NPDC127068 TaxID=3347127 RepID=UPI0036525C40
MSGRRTSLASLAGAKVDDVPGQSDLLLLSLPLEKLVPTRFNPRRNFGSEQDLREFGQKLVKKQLQPAVVVSRSAYLKLWPSEADAIGDATYVIVNGERRYRASELVGRKTLDVVHNEGVANSRADFLDAVQAENNDRENLDPIERALGIDTMVKELGGAGPVAAYYDKTKGWVSQQRKLLKLTSELQDLVSSGDLPVRIARDIAGLPDGEQGEAWKAELHRRAEAKAAPRVRRLAQKQVAPQLQPTPKQQSDSRFTAVNQLAAGAGKGENPPLRRSDVTANPLPEPRKDDASSSSGQSAGGAPRPLPYDDGEYIALHLIMRMKGPEFTKMVNLLVKENDKRSTDAEGAEVEQNRST